MLQTLTAVNDTAIDVAALEKSTLAWDSKLTELAELLESVGKSRMELVNSLGLFKADIDDLRKIISQPNDGTARVREIDTG